MVIHYRTNFMGPISTDWYKHRNLITTKSEVLETDSRISNLKKGDIFEYDHIIERWCGGRIDVYGTDDPYGYELSLPIMREDSYRLFSNWLETFETDDVWTLNQLVEFYERTNPRIIWADEYFGDE
ncbi:MAG: hypothetical protein EBU90_27735 [Proteobacteria bacterium]|nr:hypothetical protein [Pseudomonadota bacterium]